MEVWESLAFDIMEKNGYIFDSSFEANTAAILNLMQIDFSYKKLRFYFDSKNGILSYTPDFVLEDKFLGKTVLIETHGKKYIDRRFIEKMSAFENNPTSKSYYLILITDKLPKKPNKLKLVLNKYKLKEQDICDEVWYIPYNPITKQQLSISNESGSIYAKLNGLKLRSEEHIKPEKKLLRKESNEMEVKHRNESGRLQPSMDSMVESSQMARGMAITTSRVSILEKG